MVVSAPKIYGVTLLSACHSVEDNAAWWSDIVTIHGEGVAAHAVPLVDDQIDQEEAE